MEINKAYKINPVHFMEPWFVSEDVVYVESRGKAKMLLWSSNIWEDLALNNGKEYNFINLPIMRAPEYDKVLFEEKYITIKEMDRILATREREKSLQILLQNNPNSFCYIKKGGYYYRINKAGYSEYIIEAGVYTLEDAVSEVLSCSIEDCMRVVLINKEEHNNLIANKIQELSSKLL